MSKVSRPPGSRDTRGRSTELWDDVLIQSIDQDPHYGLRHRDDFDGDLSGWTQTALNSASSTGALIDGLGGHVELDPGATTANHGRQMQHGKARFGISADGILCHEWLFKLPLNSVEPFFALGLGVIDTTILSAAGALTTDGIWFVVDGADGHLDFVARSGGTDTEQEILSAPLTADAWYHAGFRQKGNGPAIPFLNNVEYREKAIVNSALPTSLLAPSVGFVGQGTIQPTFVADWVETSMNRVVTIR